MSAGFDVDAFKDESREITRPCSVVSIYEDLGARDLLLGLCDSLAWTFKGDLEFKTDWWRFKYLADLDIASEAARMAAQADLILLAARSPELPSDLRRWFETWLPNRRAGDGALVFVQPTPKRGMPASVSLMAYLRMAAARANLDYVGLGRPWPSDGAAEFPASQPELRELLSGENRPLHWGINE